MTTETQTGVKEAGEMALNFTQRNIASSFEFRREGGGCRCDEPETAAMLVGNQQN
jgi:hypothetical protein